MFTIVGFFLIRKSLLDWWAVSDHLFKFLALIIVRKDLALAHRGGRIERNPVQNANVECIFLDR